MYRNVNLENILLWVVSYSNAYVSGVHVCAYACVCVDTCLCVHVYMCACIRLYVCARVHVYVWVCFVCMYVCLCLHAGATEGDQQPIQVPYSHSKSMPETEIRRTLAGELLTVPFTFLFAVIFYFVLVCAVLHGCICLQYCCIVSIWSVVLCKREPLQGSESALFPKSRAKTTQEVQSTMRIRLLLIDSCR